MIKEHAFEPSNTSRLPAKAPPRSLAFLNDVSLQCTVEFGRTPISIRSFLGLDAGTVVELDKLQGEPVDIRVNGKLMARGEVVVVNDHYGVRITEILSCDYDEPNTP
jgi:flagellar motor switch protein FliN